MSRPDTTASAALDQPIVRPVWFGFLDFIGDPLRANTSGHSITFTGTGNADLDGFTFDGIDPTVVDIGAVQAKEGGSSPVIAKLSGIVGLDDALLAIVGDKTKWQGRIAQLWRMIRDEYGTQQGAVQHYYTGYMVALDIGGSPDAQTIEVTIESYLAAFSDASNRGYLDQDSFDPGDLSAKAAIAIANGNTGNLLTAGTATGVYTDIGGGLGAGGGRYLNTVNE